MTPVFFFSLFVFTILLLTAYLIKNTLSGRQQNRQYNENHYLSAETMPAMELSLDEADKWETLAVSLLQENRELSAIELVQKNTGLDFEEARIKLYKLEDAEAA